MARLLSNFSNEKLAVEQICLLFFFWINIESLSLVMLCVVLFDFGPKLVSLVGLKAHQFFHDQPKHPLKYSLNLQIIL